MGIHLSGNGEARMSVQYLELASRATDFLPVKLRCVGCAGDPTGWNIFRWDQADYPCVPKLRSRYSMLRDFPSLGVNRYVNIGFTTLIQFFANQ